MGRSQVLYNRRKGRNQARTFRSAMTAPVKEEALPSSLYEAVAPLEETRNDEDDNDEESSSDQVADMLLEIPTMSLAPGLISIHVDDEFSMLLYAQESKRPSLNLVQMNATMQQLSLSERFKIPQHLIDTLMDRTITIRAHPRTFSTTQSSVEQVEDMVRGIFSSDTADATINSQHSSTVTQQREPVPESRQRTRQQKQNVSSFKKEPVTVPVRRQAPPPQQQQQQPQQQRPKSPAASSSPRNLHPTTARPQQNHQSQASSPRASARFMAPTAATLAREEAFSHATTTHARHVTPSLATLKAKSLSSLGSVDAVNMSLSYDDTMQAVATESKSQSSTTTRAVLGKSASSSLLSQQAVAVTAAARDASTTTSVDTAATVVPSLASRLRQVLSAHSSYASLTMSPGASLEEDTASNKQENDHESKSSSDEKSARRALRRRRLIKSRANKRASSTTSSQSKTTTTTTSVVDRQQQQQRHPYRPSLYVSSSSTSGDDDESSSCRTATTDDDDGEGSDSIANYTAATSVAVSVMNDDDDDDDPYQADTSQMNALPTIAEDRKLGGDNDDEEEELEGWLDEALKTQSSGEDAVDEDDAAGVDDLQGWLDDEIA